MSKAFIDDTNLTNIANAIRIKLGVADTYLPSEMAGAILSIPKRKVVDFNVSSITLNGAKANSLQYVKAYGKCEQNGTPTPTSPVDIVCNNGVLKLSPNGQVYTDGTVETIEDTIGNTATAEMLLSIGDYTDEQEIISGVVSRQLDVRVFDGTENWTIHTSGAMQITVSHPLNIQTIYSICTHFEGVPASVSAANMMIGQFKLASTTNEMFFKTSYNNTTSWKNWLANQYAAGTPVIVVYPLATPTIDTVTGQPMNTTAGDNTLEITQSALSGLEVECEYFLQ